MESIQSESKPNQPAPSSAIRDHLRAAIDVGSGHSGIDLSILEARLTRLIRTTPIRNSRELVELRDRLRRKTAASQLDQSNGGAA